MKKIIILILFLAIPVTASAVCSQEDLAGRWELYFGSTSCRINLDENGNIGEKGRCFRHYSNADLTLYTAKVFIGKPENSDPFIDNIVLDADFVINQACKVQAGFRYGFAGINEEILVPISRLNLEKGIISGVISVASYNPIGAAPEVEQNCTRSCPFTMVKF